MRASRRRNLAVRPERDGRECFEPKVPGGWNGDGGPVSGVCLTTVAARLDLTQKGGVSRESRRSEQPPFGESALEPAHLRTMTARRR